MLRVLATLPRRLTGLVPWSGHHIKHLEPGTALLPWGFLSQDKVRELVMPSRKELLLRQRGLDDKEGEEEDVDTRSLYGHHLQCPEAYSLFQSLKADLELGGRQAYHTITTLYGDGCDFILHDATSPCLSNFIMDVLQTYHDQKLQPQVIVRDCKTTLTSLRLEPGFVDKNSHLLGMMGKREAMYHLLSGAIGPEQTMLAEYNGEGPRRLIAELEYNVVEDFSLVERESGKVLFSLPRQHNQHFFTLETDYYQPEETDLDWCVTNINDVIKPALSHRFINHKQHRQGSDHHDEHHQQQQHHHHENK